MADALGKHDVQGRQKHIGHGEASQDVQGRHHTGPQKPELHQSQPQGLGIGHKDCQKRHQQRQRRIILP